jgi:hypothetical protein
MRILLKPGCLFAFLCFILSVNKAYGCNQLPPGQALSIRLLEPVSTYSVKVGDPIHAVLTQDLVCDDEVVLPMGSTIQGRVRSKHKVGWGIRYETAALELEFQSVDVSPGVTVALTARVEEVENAREQVKNGVIRGIRSTNTFQGSINSRLIHLPTWNPYSDTFLIVYKAVFPIFPEPEIYYPAGTDIRLRTTAEISAPSPTLVGGHDHTLTVKPDSSEFEPLVDQLPLRVTTTSNVDADLLNIVFIGSESQVKSAFQHAGWHNADPHSKRAWMKSFYALLNNSGYANQPMTTFHLNGKPEDMDWQKDLNSYDRRDHLRVWQWKSPESPDPIWVTSSTRDTRAVLAVKYKGFVHHIAPNIDEERSTVIRDLNFAGCVKSVSYVSRPEMPTSTHNATGDVVHTDGSVAVVTLQDCHPVTSEPASEPKRSSWKPGNYAFRYIRKQILTLRSDIWRANIIYGGYDVGRRTWTALHHQPTPTEVSAPERTLVERKQVSRSVSPASPSAPESFSKEQMNSLGYYDLCDVAVEGFATNSPPAEDLGLD